MRRSFQIACSTIAFIAYAQTPPSRVEILRNAAGLIEHGDLSSAENKLELLLKQSPGDPLALDLLGLIRLRQHESAAAAKLFREAIQTGHKLPGPHINLALVYGTERPFDAIRELRQALTIAPDDGQAIRVLKDIARASSLAAVRAGQREKAASVLASATSVLPKDAELLYESGLVAYDSGAYQDADHFLTQALKLNPNYPDATYALARTYLAESLGKPAEGEMRRYLAERPADATAQYGLGYILVAEQRLEDAKAAFNRSLELQPNQTESVYQLGDIALQQGQEGLAQDYFEKVVARNPHHGGALTDLGVLAYRAAKYQEAKTDLERAIASAPTYQKAHYYYALTLSRLGEKAEAEREFTVSRSLQKQHRGEHHLADLQ